MDYLVKIRSVQTPLNGQFSIGANTNSRIDELLPFAHPVEEVKAQDDIDG